jgi:hypothetical protein
MSALEIEVLESSEITEQDAQHAPRRIAGVVIATLIGFTEDGRTPLVLCPDRPTALQAATIVDVHGTHIGRSVVVQFENGDAGRPVIMGLLRRPEGWPLPEQPGQVQVEADGERLIVTAKEQLVLKCGKASITLTKAGKILINGAYVSNRSSGVMRIKGGSVQLN